MADDVVQPGQRGWRVRAEEELRRARELGLPGADQPITEEYRRSIHGKIMDGLGSLNVGEWIAGPAFFDELLTEPDNPGEA